MLVVVRSLSWLMDIGALEKENGAFVVTLWFGVDRWITFGDVSPMANRLSPPG